MSRITDYKFRATVAVRASRIEQARDWWKDNIDLGGVREHMFLARLSGDGDEPPSWYAMQTSLRKDQLQDVRTVVDAQPQTDVRLIIWPTKYGRVNDILERVAHDPPKVRVLDSETVTFQDLLDATGMQVIQPAEA